MSFNTVVLRCSVVAGASFRQSELEVETTKENMEKVGIQA